MTASVPEVLLKSLPRPHRDAFFTIYQHQARLYKENHFYISSSIARKPCLIFTLEAWYSYNQNSIYFAISMAVHAASLLIRRTNILHRWRSFRFKHGVCFFFLIISRFIRHFAPTSPKRRNKHWQSSNSTINHGETIVSTWLRVTPLCCGGGGTLALKWVILSPMAALNKATNPFSTLHAALSPHNNSPCGTPTRSSQLAFFYYYYYSSTS